MKRKTREEYLNELRWDEIRAKIPKSIGPNLKARHFYVWYPNRIPLPIFYKLIQSLENIQRVSYRYISENLEDKLEAFLSFEKNKRIPNDHYFDIKGICKCKAFVCTLHSPVAIIRKFMQLNTDVEVWNFTDQSRLLKEVGNVLKRDVDPDLIFSSMKNIEDEHFTFTTIGIYIYIYIYIGSYASTQLPLTTNDCMSTSSGRESALDGISSLCKKPEEEKKLEEKKEYCKEDGYESNLEFSHHSPKVQLSYLEESESDKDKSHIYKGNNIEHEIKCLRERMKRISNEQRMIKQLFEMMNAENYQVGNRKNEIDDSSRELIGLRDVAIQVDINTSL